MKEELIKFFRQYGISNSSEYNNHPNKPYTRRDIKNEGFRFATLMTEVGQEARKPQSRTKVSPAKKVSETKNEK